PEGSPLTAVLSTTVSHGSLTLHADGSFTYINDGNSAAADSFTYMAYDGQSNSVAATVTITVHAGNSAPTATNDSYSGNEDATLNVAAPGVLSNDSDPDGDSMTAILVSSPAHGSLTLNADGSLTYIPALHYFGPDSFTYKANDGALDSGTATV